MKILHKMYLYIYCSTMLEINIYSYKYTIPPIYVMNKIMCVCTSCARFFTHERVRVAVRERDSRASHDIDW